MASFLQKFIFSSIFIPLQWDSCTLLFVSSSLWIIVLSGISYKNSYLIHQNPGGLFLTKVPDEGSDLISMLVISLCQLRREMDKRRPGKAARTTLAFIPTQPCCQEESQDWDFTVILAGTKSSNKDKNHEPSHSQAIFPNCCRRLPTGMPGLTKTGGHELAKPPTVSLWGQNHFPLPKTGKARKLQLCTHSTGIHSSAFPVSLWSQWSEVQLCSEARFLPDRVCGFLQGSVRQGRVGRHPLQ